MGAGDYVSKYSTCCCSHCYIRTRRRSGYHLNSLMRRKCLLAGIISTLFNCPQITVITISFLLFLGLIVVRVKIYYS